MTRQEITSRLEEYLGIGIRETEDTLALLHAALFVEEAFGITLSDADICPDTMGSHSARLRFVMERLGA